MQLVSNHNLNVLNIMLENWRWILNSDQVTKRINDVVFGLVSSMFGIGVWKWPIASMQEEGWSVSPDVHPFGSDRNTSWDRITLLKSPSVDLSPCQHPWSFFTLLVLSVSVICPFQPSARGQK